MHIPLANNMRRLFVASDGNLSSLPVTTAGIKASKVIMATLAIAGMGLMASGCISTGNRGYSPSYSSTSNCGNDSGNCKSVEQDAIDRRISTWKSQAEYQRRQDELSAVSKLPPEQQLWYWQHR
jgi:hypothetical protein